jgi:hypothetical protein
MSDTNDKFICQYCETTFATQKNLTHHINNAKYCLILQGKSNDKYKCEDCQKCFTTKTWLTQHQTNCLEYQINSKVNEIKCKYEIELQLLKDQLTQRDELIKGKDIIIKDLAEKAIINSKPTTITNNTNNTNNTTNIVNNLQVISEDHIKDQVKNLTLEHIKKGAIGYSEYFLEYPLKERIVCTDYARRKIKYKNENGEIVVDPEMTTLSDLLFKSIKERNRELTVQYTNELTDKFKSAKDPTQLSYFMEVAGKFSDQDIQVFKMFNGNKNDFFHDIIRNICGKTTVS